MLGKVIIRRYDHSYRLARILETEAYLGFDDPASHLGRGAFTPRTQGIWGRPGLAYVFLGYGLHPCFNAITLSHRPYGGVLVRGIERLRMDDGRGIPTGVRDDGPGKASRYLRIGRKHNGTDLVNGEIRILARGFDVDEVRITRRIGISRAVRRPLRFVASGFPPP